MQAMAQTDKQTEIRTLRFKNSTGQEAGLLLVVFQFRPQDQDFLCSKNNVLWSALTDWIINSDHILNTTPAIPASLSRTLKQPTLYITEEQCFVVCSD